MSIKKPSPLVLVNGDINEINEEGWGWWWHFLVGILLVGELGTILSTSTASLAASKTKVLPKSTNP